MDYAQLVEKFGWHIATLIVVVPTLVKALPFLAGQIERWVSRQIALSEKLETVVTQQAETLKQVGQTLSQMRETLDQHATELKAIRQKLGHSGPEE